jgi:prevent-host-death family protein
MASWQLQTAKSRFSELIRTVKNKGPQSITLHGHEEAVVISKKDYDRLKKKKPNLVEFFKDSPFHGADLKMNRNKAASRKVEL